MAESGNLRRFADSLGIGNQSAAAPPRYEQKVLNRLHRLLTERVAKTPECPAEYAVKEEIRELLDEKNDAMPTVMILDNPSLWRILHEMVTSSNWSGTHSKVLEHYMRTEVYGRLPNFLEHFNADDDPTRRIRNGAKPAFRAHYWPNRSRAGLVEAMSFRIDSELKSTAGISEGKSMGDPRARLSDARLPDLRYGLLTGGGKTPQDILKQAFALCGEMKALRRIMSRKDLFNIQDAFSEYFGQRSEFRENYVDRIIFWLSLMTWGISIAVAANGTATGPLTAGLAAALAGGAGVAREGFDTLYVNPRSKTRVAFERLNTHAGNPNRAENYETFCANCMRNKS